MMTWHKCDEHHKYSSFLIKYDAFGDYIFHLYHTSDFIWTRHLGGRSESVEIHPRFKSFYNSRRDMRRAR